jgi:hypothetical protein
MGCNGNTASSPAPAPKVDEFIGRVQAIGTGCGGDSHPFTPAGGSISVTLLQVTPPSSLIVMICPPIPGGAPLPPRTDCTIPGPGPEGPIDVGQTITATRRGGAEQVVSFFPLPCGLPSVGAYDFTARVTYPQ